MAKWPKIGDRIRERLLALGYQKDGRADVGRFCLERGFHPTYVYRWLGGSTPDHTNIYKLARDLKASPSWLLFGDEGTLVPPEVPKPSRRQTTIRGGSGAAALPTPTESVAPEGGALPVPIRRPRRRHNQDGVSLIRRWRAMGWGGADVWPQAA